MTEYKECKDCGGWCCASFDIIAMLKQGEAERIADYLEIPVNRFIKDYTIPHLGGPDTTFKFTRPCRFWTQGLCGIHSVKPSVCANYILGEGLGTECMDYYRKRMEEPREFKWWKYQG